VLAPKKYYRKAGKTTLAKAISSDPEYLNYDRKEDRKKILSENWDRSKKNGYF